MHDGGERKGWARSSWTLSVSIAFTLAVCSYLLDNVCIESFRAERAGRTANSRVGKLRESRKLVEGGDLRPAELQKSCRFSMVFTSTD